MEGVRVLEWGEMVSAPYCARVLATMGAEVTKIERPEGDPSRRLGPFPGDAPHPEKSGLFLALNAGKRGVTLDPTTVAGRKLLLELAKNADVLIEDHAPSEDGQGRHVDVSGVEALSQLAASNLSTHPVAPVTTRAEAAKPKLGTATEVFSCNDGYVCFSVEEQPFWERLVELMGSPEWTKDPRFKDGQSRREERFALRDLISQWMAPYSKYELYRTLQSKRIPCYPVGGPKDLIESAQLAHRGFFNELEHPIVGKLPYVTGPYRFSDAPIGLKRAAPLLGQDNEQVYCGQLGYSKDDLVALRRTGSI
jgi:crotonobetainyl-CoA:carnitine CoA-transferase CaiB-like acyl-CoA transferase